MKRTLILLCTLLFMIAVFAAAEDQAFEYTGNMEVINCSEWVSLRETPSTSAKRLVKVSLGATVSNCHSYDDEWYYAEFDGYSGYILAKYLQPCEGISTFSAMLITNCETDGTDLYPTIDAIKPVGFIQEDTIVRNCAVMGNGRVYVEYGSRCGFVDAEHAEAYAELSHFPRKITLMHNLYAGEYEGPAPALKADYAKDFPLSAYDYTEYEYEYVLEAEDIPKLEFVLHSDSVINHIHLFSIELMALDESTGDAEYEATLENIQYQLDPAHPLSVTAVIYGDTPNLAVGYQDWTGAYHFAFVEISGEDDSLMLREF